MWTKLSAIKEAGINILLQYSKFILERTIDMTTDYSKFPLLARSISDPNSLKSPPRKPIVTVDGLKAELEGLRAPLQAKLKNAKFEGEKALIQQKINLLVKTHEQAISRVKLEELAYEADLLLYNQERAALLAEIDAAKREENLATYVIAGGKPENFDRDWPDIEKTIVQQRAIDILSGSSKKSDTAINL
jgi:hypothetical protein